MLYSGHFSFDEAGDDQTLRHGYFACLARAENVRQALEKFKTRILQIRKDEKDDLFARMLAIYIEDVVEIPDDFSEDAVVTRYQSSEGPFPKSKSCFLPVSETSGLKSYDWIPDGGENEKDKNGYRLDKPFLSF